MDDLLFLLFKSLMGVLFALFGAAVATVLLSWVGLSFLHWWTVVMTVQIVVGSAVTLANLGD